MSCRLRWYSGPEGGLRHHTPHSVHGDDTDERDGRRRFLQRVARTVLRIAKRSHRETLIEKDHLDALILTAQPVVFDSLF